MALSFLNDIMKNWAGRQNSLAPVAPVVPPPTIPIPAAPTPAEIAAAERPAALARSRAEAERKAELLIRERGLDPTTYLPMVRSEFDRIQANLDPTSDPRLAFDNTTASSLLSGEASRRKMEYTKAADATFSSGQTSRDLPSSLLDDTINSILGDQRKSASDYLERGKARGIYNDVGYAAGTNSLNNADAMGRSELSSLGGSVLDKYRSSADTVRDKAYGDLSGFSLGRDFKLDPYISEYQDVLGRARSNAGGDLRGMVGGRNFFDLSKLGQSAGQAQGAINLRDTDVATALNSRRRTNSMSRGLGSQGAF